jgi:hypothetical protein
LVMILKREEKRKKFDGNSSGLIFFATITFTFLFYSACMCHYIAGRDDAADEDEDDGGSTTSSPVIVSG